MDDEERHKRLPCKSVEQEIPSQASPLVMQRREMTAGFDDRQKQLFNEALIAILTVDMPAEKITEVLTKAYDTTIQVFGWQMLADTFLPNDERGSEVRPVEQSPSPAATECLSAPDSVRPVLLSCTNCHGYKLKLSGAVIQCDDCGAIQPKLDSAADRESAHTKMLGIQRTPKKEIVNVTVNGSTLALMVSASGVKERGHLWCAAEQFHRGTGVLMIDEWYELPSRIEKAKAEPESSRVDFAT
jgi:hypothetical protein